MSLRNWAESSGSDANSRLPLRLAYNQRLPLGASHLPTTRRQARDTHRTSNDGIMFGAGICSGAMNSDDTIYIGNRHIWGGEQPFGLSRADRRQHLYVIGKTGTGKTTLLRNLILQLVEAGEGVGVIDPHGDLSLDLLEHIPPRRINDIVYLNPADQDYPFAFNLFHPVPPRSRHLVTSSVVSAMKSIWRDSWGPRLEYVLTATVSALLECQNTTILGVQRMLNDPLYREWVVKQVRDPATRDFWTREFAGYDKRFLSEIISPIQNKVGAMVMSAAPLRLVLGQVAGRFTPRFTMDNRRILIANLSKGLLGETGANLLGSLLVSQFQSAAMMRANLPEQERVDFNLFVDEFHNFATDSFCSILAEMRKYRLCLTLSHQHLEQVPDEIRHSIFGNVGSLVAFRAGESDAAVLSREFGGGFDPAMFANLDNGEICAKLLEGGRHAGAFLATTLPPVGIRHGKSHTIIRRSRQRFATPRNVVESKLSRWMKR